MRRVLTMAMLGVGLAFANPAIAAVTIVGPPATASSCTNFTFSGATEVSCAGGYSGNLNQGSPLTGTGLTAIQALGYTGTGAYPDANAKDFNGGNTNTISFAGQTFSGLTIIGLHYGQSGDPGGNATSFFSFLAAPGTTSITVTGRAHANELALSNMVLYSTGGAVPEPATWAMMLLGFGAIGFSMRRHRKQTMPQVA